MHSDTYSTSMFALRTSEEFARWFAALDQATAEDVAATIELIEQLAPAKDPPSSSDWLTWYEDASVSGRLLDLELCKRFDGAVNAAVARFVREWGAFNGYARRAIEHLESPAFVERLTQLDERRAAAVTGAVARIRRATARRVLA